MRISNVLGLKFETRDAGSSERWWCGGRMQAKHQIGVRKSKPKRIFIVNFPKFRAFLLQRKYSKWDRTNFIKAHSARLEFLYALCGKHNEV